MRAPSILVPSLLLVFLLTIPLAALGQSTSTQRSYRWEYGGRTWTLTHSFSTEHYRFFRTLPRFLDYADYTDYVNDPRDDEQLRSLIDALERLAADAGLDAWAKLNLVIAFVQSIPYAGELCEYPRYPLETLVEQQGDCEDAAILAAALLRQMHFDVVLLAFLEERHMALGICVLPPTPVQDAPYVCNGGSYYYLEPTTVGWEIGQVPSLYRSQPTILPFASVFASAGR
jgi:hypothetical protein